MKRQFFAIGLVLLLAGMAPERANAQAIPVGNADLNLTPDAKTGRFDLQHWTTQGTVNGWNGPLGPAVEITDGASLTQTVTLTPLEGKQSEKAKWGLLLAVDVLGKTGQTSAGISLSLANGDETVLAKERFTIDADAQRSTAENWQYFADSVQGKSTAAYAFDNDPQTIWHTKYSPQKDPFPHFLAVDFGTVKQLTGFAYLPRQAGTANGVVDQYEFQISRDGEKWTTVTSGRFEYGKNKRQSQQVKFRRTASARFARLVCLSEIHQQPFATCAELSFAFRGATRQKQVKEDEPDDEFARRESLLANRFFLAVDPKRAAGLKDVQLRIEVADNAAAVIDGVHLCHLPDQASKPLLGKANGKTGPDLLGAGSYGFDAMMVHRQVVLPVMQVRPNSPAAKAGLRGNDVVVGVNGEFLPPGDLDPGFYWFHNSHEAILGRAALAAYARSAKSPGVVQLNVLRNGAVENLALKLNLPVNIADDDFLTAPEKISTLNDELIAHVLQHQQDDGSWRKNPILTSLGGLALLSTGEQKYARQIKSAANWLLSKHATPDTGFYWFPAWGGIFLGEYFLATGDERVLPVMQRNLRVMESGFHTSKWGMPTLGHGPRGLPYGNKSLVAPAVHILVFEALAKRCGIESNIHETLWPFMLAAYSDPEGGGHGGLGYNASLKDLEQFFSRSGLFALALELRNEHPEMQQALVKIMHERHPWFRNSHAYGEPGGLTGMLGIHAVDEAKFRDILRDYQWWFALALEPGHGLHFTIPHMGAPYMEGEELINNGYAIVTNADRRTLHITGSTKTNWLDISRIPVPVSDVMILQLADGKVLLKCEVPGPKIHYTTDGSTPTSRSPAYRSPFAVGDHSVVKAVAFGDDGSASKIASRRFGCLKANWSVVAASGHHDAAEAKARAARLFDGDEAVCWITDVGEESTTYPYEVIIDLGGRKQASAVTLLFPIKAATPGSIKALGADSSPGRFRPLGESTLNDYQQIVTVKFGEAEAFRFLKLQFAQPLQKDSPLLMIGEMELQ